MKKLLLFISAILILSVGCGTKSPAGPIVKDTVDNPYNQKLFVEDKTLFVQIVSVPADMKQGLSGRSKLNDNQGMLFDFGLDASAMPNFWMKDMKFDLDLVWIKNNKIVGITPNVPAPKNQSGILPAYAPPLPVDRVLEVSAGWTEKNKIKIGDEIRLR